VLQGKTFKEKSEIWKSRETVLFRDDNWLIAYVYILYMNVLYNEKNTPLLPLALLYIKKLVAGVSQK
jgi:hypothetical protein